MSRKKNNVIHPYAADWETFAPECYVVGYQLLQRAFAYIPREGKKWPDVFKMGVFAHLWKALDRGLESLEHGKKPAKIGDIEVPPHEITRLVPDLTIHGADLCARANAWILFDGTKTADLLVEMCTFHQVASMGFTHCAFRAEVGPENCAAYRPAFVPEQGGALLRYCLKDQTQWHTFTAPARERE